MSEIIKQETEIIAESNNLYEFSRDLILSSRKFYLHFPNIYALRKELSWTHYCSFNEC